MNELEVQQKARTFCAALDTSNIRNDLSVYFNAANARVRKEELGDGESGYTLTKNNGQHVVTVNSLETDERQRFTVCHEIAHIILKLPSNHHGVPSWSYAKRDPNEILCDTFAAELLMPYKMWKEALPNSDPSAETIEQMAEAFRVSFPAAASRFANLADFPCALVTIDGGVVRHMARSTALRRAGAWISPRSAVPEGSVARRIRSAGKSQTETAEVGQDVWFEDWEKGLDLWEMARHYHQFDTTISLLWLPDDEMPEVEVDRFGKRIAEDIGLTELTGELPWPSRSRRRP
jgi:Zn-dependent peptidase ImmA (M78 family)